MRTLRLALLLAPAHALLLVGLARFAHANAPMGRYVIPTTGMVYDTKTKLTWQQLPPPSALYSWDVTSPPNTAQSYCAALSLGGLSGWRLPTISELQTLVDYSQTGTLFDGGPSPMIDTTYFPGTPPAVFWSSTPFATFGTFAWGVNFSFGNSNGYQMAPANYVRCVR